MRFQDFFRFGVINLSRRKARTMLTALSMAIGVMCIIVLISVGIGYEKSYEETIQSMGSLTKIDVTPSTDERGAQALLNDKAVDAHEEVGQRGCCHTRGTGDRLSEKRKIHLHGEALWP